MSNVRRTNIKQAHKHGAKPGFVKPVLAQSPLSLSCPKCEAEPGWSCRRWIAGRVCGKETGGGYWRELKKVHRERHRSPKRAA